MVGAVTKDRNDLEVDTVMKQDKVTWANKFLTGKHVFNIAQQCLLLCPKRTVNT